MAPLGVVAIIGAALSIISFLRRPSRRQRTQLQFIASIFSWTSLWFATASSFASSGMTNLTSHMIGHVIVMFLVPIGLILSGTARSWWWLLPVDSRRKVLRWWNVDRNVRVPKFFFNPISAALVLNVVMVTSHIPAVFDASMEHRWEMDYLLEPSFLLSGLFFFHFIVSSSPRKNKVGIRLQLFMVLSTMLEMLVMAMSLSIFSNSAWYAVMKPMECQCQQRHFCRHSISNSLLQECCGCAETFGQFLASYLLLEDWQIETVDLFLMPLTEGQKSSLVLPVNFFHPRVLWRGRRSTLQALDRLQ